MNKKEVFFEQLQNIFIGSPINGYGGYVNLLRIKNKYYNNIVNELKKEINNDSIIDDQFEEDFYNKLYNFFIRYFNDCGSIFYSKTTNNDKIYEQVYKNNEDVSLFWKTNMLYYVKSDILFNDVDIKVRLNDNDKWTIFRFDVGKLKNKQNNEKLDLDFKIERQIKEKTEEDSEDYIVLVKVYLKEEKIDIEKNEEISKKLNINCDLIEKAIIQFKKQTSVDFFINKNAKKFLNEQLDLYLHNILLEENSEFDEKRLLQLKTIKKYSMKIISFISQFEDELVRIWNKPKFVLNSNYVITIDKINDEILKKIGKSEGLKEQIEEWKMLKIVEDDFKWNTEQLKKYKHLPIDTKFFKELEIEILEQFDDLDEALDGRLIHSENYQALNTIKEKYRSKIQCVYIDPPFNTGKDFEYTDGYQDSSWCSLMNNRFELAKILMNGQGSFYLHLDENADFIGRMLFKIFNFNQIKEITFHTMSATDEFASTFGMKNVPARNFVQESQTIYYGRYDECKFYKMWKPNRRTSRLNINSLDLIAEKIPNHPLNRKDSYNFYIERYDDKGKLQHVYIDGAKTEKIYTMGDIWNDILSMSQSSVRQHGENVSFQGQKPEALLRRIIQSSSDENDYVLDFFAGTGTTALVAHKLNRKWLIIEMGDHFNEIYRDLNEEKIGCLGRLKLVLNCDKHFYVPNSEQRRSSTLSQDINWQGGGFFKYYEFEQYEDTLNKMKYKNDALVSFEDDIYNQYVFFSDKKLTDFVAVNEKDIKINFDSLYENIDLPETISLALGESIKKITKDEVILEKTGPVKYNIKKMNNDEKKKLLSIIKEFIWWGK